MRPELKLQPPKNRRSNRIESLICGVDVFGAKQGESAMAGFGGAGKCAAADNSYRRRVGKRRAVIKQAQLVADGSQFVATGNKSRGVGVRRFFSGRQQDEKLGLRVFGEKFPRGYGANRGEPGLGFGDQIINL